jgi:hypothetical protein
MIYVAIGIGFSLTVLMVGLCKAAQHADAELLAQREHEARSHYASPLDRWKKASWDRESELELRDKWGEHLGGDE